MSETSAAADTLSREAPEVPAAPVPSVAAAASRVFSREVKRLLKHEAAARGGEDPEAIHQMRVGVRRLRAGFRAFGEVVKRSKALRQRAVRELADALGRVRDADVELALLEGGWLPRLGSAEASRLESLIASLKFERWRAQQALRRYLKGRGYAKLRRALEGLAARPSFVGGADDASAAGAPAVEFLRGAALETEGLVREHPGMQRSRADADTLHQLRIALKRHRYLLEFIALVTGEEPGEPLDLAQALQDCLGELHDHDLLLERLHGTATERDSPFWHQHWSELPGLVARDRRRLRRKFGRLRARWLAMEGAAAPAAPDVVHPAVAPEPAAVRPAVHVALVQPAIIVRPARPGGGGGEPGVPPGPSGPPIIH